MEIDRRGRITPHTIEELQDIWDIHHRATGTRPHYWAAPAVECIGTPFSTTTSGVIHNDLTTYAKTAFPGDKLGQRAEKMLCDIEPKKSFEFPLTKFLKFPVDRLRSVLRSGRTIGRLALEQSQ